MLSRWVGAEILGDRRFILFKTFVQIYLRYTDKAALSRIGEIFADVERDSSSSIIETQSNFFDKD